VESGLDFSDEEVDALAPGEIVERLQALDEACREVESQAEVGAVMSDGIRLVIAGPATQSVS